METKVEDLPTSVGVGVDEANAVAAEGEEEEVAAHFSDQEDEFAEPFASDLASSEKYDGPKVSYASAECHDGDIE